MGLTYDIPSSGDHVRVTASGVLTTDDLVAVIERITSDTRWLLYASALVDLRAATYVHNGAEEIIHVATTVERFRSALKGNIAIVAGPHTAFLAGIFATHVSRNTAIPIKVFMDLAAAEEFCKILTPSRLKPRTRPTVGPQSAV
jgi:hypothetical protein